MLKTKKIKTSAIKSLSSYVTIYGHKYVKVVLKVEYQKS
jgi:hypothetical protein